jgi:hypothetical protein
MCAMRKRKYWLWPFVGIGFLALGTWVVMLLWNNVVVDVIPAVKELTYWKALGLLVLCKILFGHGGPRGGWKGRSQNGGGGRWREKWAGMSEEEKARVKDKWKNKCGNWNE